MVPANDEHTDSTEATSDTNKKERERGRLTPMPNWLMKWWIPPLLALILLAAGCFLASIWRMPLKPFSWGSIKPFSPPSWPFNYHWPSKDAMALCATIAGAGFAFSAWQQKSHNNAVNAKQAQATAKQAQATAEREDYWKRREHIFQLLGSDNSRLRLAAIELLTELADATKRSSILTDEEKRHLQIHIVNTLCLQLRHEGTIDNLEIVDGEHAEVQRTIINAILIRIKRNQESNAYADWAGMQINLNGARILPEVNINSIHTSARINISDTHFLEKVTITNSTFGPVQWEQTTFEKGLTIGSADEPVSLYASTMPLCTTETYLTNVTFFTSGTKVSTQINKQAIDRELTKLTIDNCRFYTSECRCDLLCKCRTIPPSSEICTCKARGVCKCESECINATVEILSEETTNETLKEAQVNRQVNISKSTFYSIVIHLNNTHSAVTLDSNTITNKLILKLEGNDDRNITQHSPTEATRATISNNDFIITPSNLPIEIEFSSNRTTEPKLEFSNNYLSCTKIYFSSTSPLPSYRTIRKQLIARIVDSEDGYYHFSTEDSSNISTLIKPWSTGHRIKINRANDQR